MLKQYIKMTYLLRWYRYAIQLHQETVVDTSLPLGIVNDFLQLLMTYHGKLSSPSTFSTAFPFPLLLIGTTSSSSTCIISSSDISLDLKLERVDFLASPSASQISWCLRDMSSVFTCACCVPTTYYFPYTQIVTRLASNVSIHSPFYSNQSTSAIINRNLIASPFVANIPFRSDLFAFEYSHL